MTRPGPLDAGRKGAVTTPKWLHYADPEMAPLGGRRSETQTLRKVKIDDILANPALSPRLNQILIPSLTIIDDEALRGEILEAVSCYDQKLYQDRAPTIEANVLDVLQGLYATGPQTSISIAEITTALAACFAGKHERPVTTRVVGAVLRKRLRLLTWKSHGVYVFPVSEQAKVAELCVRYGLSAQSQEA